MRHARQNINEIFMVAVASAAVEEVESTWLFRRPTSLNDFATNSADFQSRYDFIKMNSVLI